MARPDQNSIGIDKCAKLVGFLPAASARILDGVLAVRSAKELNRKKKERLTPGIIEVATVATQVSMHASIYSNNEHPDKAAQNFLETFHQLFKDTFKSWSTGARDPVEWNRIDAKVGNALKHAQERHLTAADVLADKNDMA